MLRGGIRRTARSISVPATPTATPATARASSPARHAQLEHPSTKVYALVRVIGSGTTVAYSPERVMCDATDVMARLTWNAYTVMTLRSAMPSMHVSARSIGKRRLLGLTAQSTVIVILHA